MNKCHYPRDLIKHGRVNAKINVSIGQDMPREYVVQSRHVAGGERIQLLRETQTLLYMFIEELNRGSATVF